MVDQQAMLAVTKRYARTILGSYEVGDVLDRLSDDIAAVLGVDGAGVSVGDEGGELRWVAATDSTVAEVERRQVEVGDGPCHEAYRSGEAVHGHDLREERRWPAYTSYTLDRGWRAVAGIPMFAGDERIGAVNAYSREPRRWSTEDLEAGRALADLASGYITNAIRYDETRRLSESLQHALESRVVIEQAKGIIAERRGITPAEAFELLRGNARSTRTRIHDVAGAVVAGGGPDGLR